MSLFRGIQCTLDTSVHNNFYLKNLLRDNNVINSFPPRASSGSILDLCSFRNSKFQKSKLDSALNVTVSWDQVHIGHFWTIQLLLYICCSTIVSLTVFLQEPRVGVYWTYALSVNQNMKKTGFCSKCNCFRGSSAHWTRLYKTTSTINMLRGNSVIHSFPPRASSGTILDLCSFRNSKFQKSKLDSALNVTVSWNKCILDTSSHDYFYSTYVALQ